MPYVRFGYIPFDFRLYSEEIDANIFILLNAKIKFPCVKGRLHLHNIGLETSCADKNNCWRHI